MSKLDENALIGYFSRHLPDLQALYLYGSRVQDQSGADSDVDIALLTPSSVTSVRRHQLAQGLAAQIGHDVDLIDLRTVSTVMRMQVIAKGRRLFGEGGEIDLFEDRSYAEYARLNEERAGILADIQRRGSIHGG